MHKAILFLERVRAAYFAKDCCQPVMLITYVFEHYFCNVERALY
jgi:hypothetical protein